VLWVLHEGGEGGFDLSLVEDLKQMLDQCNPLCKSFRKIRDLVDKGSPPKMALRLFHKREKDSRMHNLPTADEVVGLIVGDYDLSEQGRDIIVDDVSKGLRKLHETHLLEQRVFRKITS